MHNGEITNVFSKPLVGVFNNSFDEEYFKTDELFKFEGKSVEITQFLFDYNHDYGADAPDVGCYPMMRMRITCNGKWFESFAWCDEITPMPLEVGVYLEGLACGSKYVLDTLVDYEEMSSIDNPYPIESKNRKIFKLGFACYWYKL